MLICHIFVYLYSILLHMCITFQSLVQIQIIKLREQIGNWAPARKNSMKHWSEKNGMYFLIVNKSYTLFNFYFLKNHGAHVIQGAEYFMQYGIIPQFA